MTLTLISPANPELRSPELTNPDKPKRHDYASPYQDYLRMPVAKKSPGSVRLATLIRVWTKQV
jgi:hypothetical protein